MLPSSRLTNFGMVSLGKGLTGLGVVLGWCKGLNEWLGPGGEGRWLQVQGTHRLLAPFWGDFPGWGHHPCHSLLRGDDCLAAPFPVEKAHPI